MYVNVEAGKIRIYPSDQIRLLQRDLRQVHQDMGQELQLFVQMGFEGEHAPDGTPWQPLAKSTVRKRGSANPILRVSGRMARTHLRANSQEAVIGSNLAYAAIHQHGGEIKRQGGTLKAADVYHVLVDATAVTGLDGAPFAGIADSTTLNFATA